MDRFTDFYPRRVKEQNLARLKGQDGFRFREDDLLTADLTALLSGVTYVFHLAGRPVPAPLRAP